jgi:hypothetical protein
MGRAFTSIGVVALVSPWWGPLGGGTPSTVKSTGFLVPRAHCPLNVSTACPRLVAWWRTLPNYSERDRIML